MSYRILLVDDDTSFRYNFREILEEYYDVIDISSGRETIELIKRPNIIDLVMLDIKMPDIQGTQVLREIKAIDPDISVIMLTGYSQKELIVESLRGHADDFLEKPVKVELALTIIENLLDKKQQKIMGTIDKIKYFIQRNFQKKISLKEASDAVCLSPKYISKLFKENTGIGFNEYKLQLKMEKAKEFLDSSDLNINQISSYIGYNNVESFVRIFKQMQGCTPTEYRQKVHVGNH